MEMSGYATRPSADARAKPAMFDQREAIVSTFTQDAGALAAVDANWIIATDLEPQTGTATADIQYVTANVMQYQDALGLQASAVST
jgi:hypothetical protein